MAKNAETTGKPFLADVKTLRDDDPTTRHMIEK